MPAPEGFSDTFEVSPWQIKPLPSKPAFADDHERKKLFGIELAKNDNPLKAAGVVFWNDADALWVANNWLHDPVVKEAKSNFEEKQDQKLLDKEGLSRKLLKFAEEKDRTGQFYVCEAKERLAALRLYAEIQGYIGKNDIDLSTKNYINGMTVKFVGSDKQNDNKTIDAVVETKEINPLPINVKLVSSK